MWLRIRRLANVKVNDLNRQTDRQTDRQTTTYWTMTVKNLSENERHNQSENFWQFLIVGFEISVLIKTIPTNYISLINIKQLNGKSTSLWMNPPTLNVQLQKLNLINDSGNEIFHLVINGKIWFIIIYFDNIFISCWRQCVKKQKNNIQYLDIFKMIKRKEVGGCKTTCA